MADVITCLYRRASSLFLGKSVGNVGVPDQISGTTPCSALQRHAHLASAMPDQCLFASGVAAIPYGNTASTTLDVGLVIYKLVFVGALLRKSAGILLPHFKAMPECCHLQ